MGKNTYSNRRVANHLHGLIFELKERMNSRQDRPVKTHTYIYTYKQASRQLGCAAVVASYIHCTSNVHTITWTHSRARTARPRVSLGCYDCQCA